MPSISQIAGVPSLPCHRMSDLPSPLKSPLPLICQLGPGLNEPAAPTATALRAVHQPDRRRAVAALPQDVGLAVAVEVAGALDLPARPRIERAGGTDSHRVDAVHQPDRRRAVAALPQDVGLAVAVEVAGALITCQDGPGLDRTAAPDTRVRAIVQIPDRGMPSVVLPQEVAAAVGVEVSVIYQMPARADDWARPLR